MAGVLSPSVAPPPACPAPMKATSNGAWQKENPLDYALPLVILQICLVVALTRALAFLLRRLRQPRVIAEIIGGILLGPSALGRNQAFLDAVFPKRSLTLLDTLANIGLLFFLFLVGLELDLNSIRRTGREALAIAVAGISLPFVLGVGTSFVLRATIAAGVPQAPFLVFMGVALSITAFPVLARILAELKLLTTDVGRMAMSAAAVNDVVAWILLALAVALSGSGSPLVSLWVLISGALFVVLAALAIRPVLVWMAHRCQEGEPVKEIYICVTLATVLAASFITDTIGIHALFGAFVVGIVVPKEGPFACILIEKIEDLVSGLLLPLYFVSSGLKTNIAAISSGRSWGLLVLVITTSCLGKVVGTIAAARIARVPSREALTLGILMNTKGLVELIVLNIGKDRKVLNEETFAIMVLMALFTTFITTPIVMAIYKPARPPVPYKNRTIMSLANQPDSKLRMLACFNRARSIPSIINLIETSRGIGSRRGLTVYALHLMELSERSSAISMVNRVRNGFPFWNRGRSSEGDGNNHIEVAFEAYEQLSGVSVRPMMAISDLSTIHEDVVALAQEKRVAMILLPFHKQQCIDNFMESLGASFRHINKSVLEHAPCSVGILVDRGLGGQAQVTSSDVSCSIAVLFFGGRDDREALSYGTRMAHHPGVVLTVLRFQTEPGKTLIENSSNGESVGVNVEGDQRAADDEFMMASSKNCLMKCMVKTVKDKADIVNGISTLGPINLFLVGRTPPVAALTSRTDCPELGPVGSYLASSEFSTAASVLVVQQYHPNGNDELPIQAHLSQGGNEGSDAANGSQP